MSQQSRFPSFREGRPPRTSPYRKRHHNRANQHNVAEHTALSQQSPFSSFREGRHPAPVLSLSKDPTSNTCSQEKKYANVKNNITLPRKGPSKRLSPHVTPPAEDQPDSNVPHPDPGGCANPAPGVESTRRTRLSPAGSPARTHRLFHFARLMT